MEKVRKTLPGQYVFRRHMAEILSIRPKTLTHQSINISFTVMLTTWCENLQNHLHVLSRGNYCPKHLLYLHSCLTQLLYGDVITHLDIKRSLTSHQGMAGRASATTKWWNWHISSGEESSLTLNERQLVIWKPHLHSQIRGAKIQLNIKKCSRFGPRLFFLNQVSILQSWLHRLFSLLWWFLFGQNDI